MAYFDGTHKQSPWSPMLLRPWPEKPEWFPRPCQKNDNDMCLDHNNIQHKLDSIQYQIETDSQT